MPTQESIEELEKQHNLRMASYSNQNRGIVISAPVLIGAILVLIQMMMGLGIWALQDRLNKYDAFEPRITAVEQTLVKFEDIPDDLNNFISEFRAFTREPRFTETDFNNKIADKITPIKDQLDRIEKRVVEKNDMLETEVETEIKRMQQQLDAVIKTSDDNEQRVRNIETEIEIYKRINK